MNNRFRKREPDFKENILSPANKISAINTKSSFFERPCLDSEVTKPLSPVQSNKILSPNKKTFFPSLDKDDDDKVETPEPKAPARTVSRLASMRYTPENTSPTKSSLTRSPSRVASLKESFEKRDSRSDEPIYSIPLKHSRSRSPINRQNSIKSPNSKEKTPTKVTFSAKESIPDRRTSPRNNPNYCTNKTQKEITPPVKKTESIKQSFRQSPYRTRGYYNHLPYLSIRINLLTN